MPVIPILLVLAQTPDPRLDVHASLEAPRLTYAEVGAWVQEKTKIPVYVVPAIRERKATILVEDRPVRETMDRISEALFVEWEKTKDGYTMRIPAQVQAEESAMASAEPGAAQEVLRWKMKQVAAIGQKSKEGIKAELDDVNAQYAELNKDKDKSPEALDQMADLVDRIGLLSNAYYTGFSRGMAMVASKISPAMSNAVLQGTTLYASNPPRPGFLPLPREAINAMRENSPMLSPDKQVLYSVKYLPPTQEILFSYGMPEGSGAGGGSLSIKGNEGARYRRALSRLALNQRLKEWSVTDAKFMETKVAPKPPAPVGRHQTTYKTLSDVLVDLHQRTGVPIVADGYRQALVARRPPEGTTLAQWNLSLGQWSDGRYRGYRPLARTGSGWFMMRHPQYWQRVAGEVPEAPIRRLEAACAQPGKATIDDFAAFANAVGPDQEPYVSADWLVMEAPSAAIAGNLHPLRLWAALPSVLRKTASSEAGLDLSTIPSNQQRLAMACLDERSGSVFGSERELAYLLPGGLPWPKDLHFFVNLNAKAMNMEYQEFIQDDPDSSRLTSWDSQNDSVAGVSINIGTKEFSMVNYSIPLRPSRKIWPDEG